MAKDRPDIPHEKIARIRQLMDESVPDALVTGYEAMIGTLSLPDPEDRHVLAAAIRRQAGVIVTINVRDFPEKDIAPFGIEVQHPDDFVTHLMDLDRTAVCVIAREHRQALKNPPKTAAEYLATLSRNGLTKTAVSLEEWRDLL